MNTSSSSRLTKPMLAVGTGNSDWKHYASKHAVKVKSRVRKGIPDRLRGVAWQLLSGGRDLLLQNEGVSVRAQPWLSYLWSNCADSRRTQLSWYVQAAMFRHPTF